MWKTKGSSSSKSCARADLSWTQPALSCSSRFMNSLKNVCLGYAESHTLSQVPLLKICAIKLFFQFLNFKNHHKQYWKSNMIKPCSGIPANRLISSCRWFVLSHRKQLLNSQPLTIWEILSRIRSLLTKEVSSFKGLTQSRNSYWRYNLFCEIQSSTRKLMCYWN